MPASQSPGRYRAASKTILGSVKLNYGGHVRLPLCCLCWCTLKPYTYTQYETPLTVLQIDTRPSSQYTCCTQYNCTYAMVQVHSKQTHSSHNSATSTRYLDTLIQSSCPANHTTRCVKSFYFTCVRLPAKRGCSAAAQTCASRGSFHSDAPEAQLYCAARQRQLTR